MHPSIGHAALSQARAAVHKLSKHGDGQAMQNMHHPPNIPEMQRPCLKCVSALGLPDGFPAWPACLAESSIMVSTLGCNAASSLLLAWGQGGRYTDLSLASEWMRAMGPDIPGCTLPANRTLPSVVGPKHYAPTRRVPRKPSRCKGIRSSEV